MGDRRGSTIIEFTLVGIPLLFVLLSIFEVARGMWVYTTLAHAVREGNRVAIVHGNNCALYPNSCSVRIRDVAQRITDAGVGLLPDQLELQFISATRTVPSGGSWVTLAQCLQSGSTGDTWWPGAGPGAATPDVGGNQFSSVEVRGRYPFRSAISMFWPGAGPGMVFGAFLLPANARERIQY